MMEVEPSCQSRRRKACKTHPVSLRHNSCRSQVVAGLINHFFQAFSVGVVVRNMGIAPTGFTSK
jgi:hypothetical protein